MFNVSQGGLLSPPIRVVTIARTPDGAGHPGVKKTTDLDEQGITV